MAISLKYFLATVVTAIFLYHYFYEVSIVVPVVHAPVGSIKGTLLKSKYGRNIFAYTGIPYAEAPIGPLRFKRPKPLPDNSWEGVFDGSNSVTKCVQLSEIPMLRTVNGAEDCLQLNVYVPQQNSSEYVLLIRTPESKQKEIRGFKRDSIFMILYLKELQSFRLS